MKRKAFVFRLILLCLCACFLIACVYEAQKMPDYLQYAALPMEDGSSPQKWLSSLIELSGQWESSVGAWTLDAVIEDCAVLSEDGRRAEASVCFSGENHSSLFPQDILAGRYFSKEESATGEKVVLIDRKLSHELFRTTQAEGRDVIISGASFRVVGVVDHESKPGEKNGFFAYAPYLSLEKAHLSPDVLIVTAKPLPLCGAEAAFSYAVRAWTPRGSEINLKKEKMALTLWARMLAFIVGVCAVCVCLRFLKKAAINAWMRYQTLLKTHYAAALFPKVAMASILLAAGFLALLFALYGLLDFLIRPVYTFTEYVPESFASWSQIRDTFVGAVRNSSGALLVRTKELLYLRFLTGCIRVFTALCGILIASFTGRYISK